jgi:hypothetical protein
MVATLLDLLLLLLRLPLPTHSTAKGFLGRRCKQENELQTTTKFLLQTYAPRIIHSVVATRRPLGPRILLWIEEILDTAAAEAAGV